MIRSGEWEVIQTSSDGKRVFERRHSISEEEARNPSIRCLLDQRGSICAHWELAKIADGCIEGHGTVSSGDGNIRERPIKIVGTYSAEQFSMRETFYLFGIELADDYEGRYVGPRGSERR